MLIPLPDERVEILGASWFEPTERGLLPHRLPAWTRTQWPDVGYGQNVTQGSGVRLRFTTASDRVVLHVAVSRGSYRGPGPEDVPSEVGPPAVFDWIVDGDLVASTSPDEAGIITFDARDGSLTDCPGPPSTVSLDLPSASGEPRTVEVWG